MIPANFIILAAAATLLLGASPARASVITFESVPLPPAGYDNDADGGFIVDQVTFNNNFDGDTQAWSGFAISNRTDTVTQGSGNAFSAITGGGFGGLSNFAVGLYSTTDPISTHVIFNSATNLVGLGAYFTNTTWAALDMLNGGGPGSKKFGGPTGNDPDWFKLTIRGMTGATSTGFVEFFLADFRDSNNALDHVVTNWRFVDFSPLGSPERLEMSLSASDNSQTPLYFAMDQFMTVPEPSALMLALAGIGLVFRRRR